MKICCTLTFSNEKNNPPDAGDESRGEAASCSDGELTWERDLIVDLRTQCHVANARMARMAWDQDMMYENVVGVSHGRIKPSA